MTETPRIRAAARVTVSGAPEGHDARLVLRALEDGAPAAVHVARDDRRLEAMRAALAFYAPGVAVL
ncbi:MAG: hypothetical protein JJU40_07365, partial [Rhodobacteraceae bacterium]|nr:hypothetical protein [Paracoccaceae bacterium]